MIVSKKRFLALENRLKEMESFKDHVYKEYTPFVSDGIPVNKNYLYTIHDKAADFCQPVHCSPCDPQRHLLELRRAAMNGAFRFPEDLELIFLGFFDDHKALIQVNEFSGVVGSLALPEGFERTQAKEVSKHAEN